MTNNTSSHDDVRPGPSLVTDQLLLVLLDRARGKAVPIEELTQQFIELIGSMDGLLFKYTDADKIVDDDLRYLEDMQFADRIAIEDGEAARITTLGRFIGLALNVPALP